MSVSRDLLVVEDERVVLEAARRILEPEGLVMETAGDAGSAIEWLRQHRFRVLLCDLMLPGGSGFDLISRARAVDPAIQCVVVTGYATLDNALDSFRLGAFDCIPKPFDSEELRGVVARALAFRDLLLDGENRLRAGFRRPGPVPAPLLYTLGAHSWVRVDDDSSVTLGAGESFSEALRQIESIALPAVGERAVQGRGLVEIRSGDRALHRVWAPLSGPIVAVNERLENEPEVLLAEPFGAGWLVKILPESLEDELRHLTAGGEGRAADEAAPAD